MSFAAHGYWCGPGWSAGKWKDAKDLTEEDKQVEAIDALDQACKEHDIGIAEGDPLANHTFYKKAAAAGWYGLTLAQFVKIGGPSLQNYLRGGELVNNLQKARQEKQKKQERIWEAELDQKFEERMRNKRKASQELDDQRELNRNPPVDLTYEEEEETKEGEAWRDDPALAEMMDAVEENERAMAENNMVTPEQPTPRMAPRLTRQDRPLRGFRPQGSLTNLLNQVDNQQTMSEDVPMLPSSLRSGEGGSQRKQGNRETLVRYNTRAELGIFTETRTAYLPITFYLSINRLKNRECIPLLIRLDWPYNILSQNTLVAQYVDKNVTHYTQRSRGLSNDMVGRAIRGVFTTPVTGKATINIDQIASRDVSRNQGQLYPFPTTIKGDSPANYANDVSSTIPSDPIVQDGNSSYGTISDSNVIPAYRRWYANMYQYAHCMETDYRIEYIPGDENEEFQNMSVYEGMDCVSAGNTDRIPTNQPIGRVAQWPYIKQHSVVHRSAEKPQKRYVIKGTWTPNEQRPNKMIPNEEDVKTWTRLNSETGDFQEKENQYREDLVLMHYSHPDSANIGGFYNVRVDLTYKVQFKDLKSSLRWFGQGGYTTLNTNTCHQIPFPTNDNPPTHLSNPEFIGNVNITSKR